MKLATTTGDFAAYTKSQSEALAHIRNAGFRYADYSFVQDYAQRSGVFGVDYRQYYDRINETQAALGLRSSRPMLPWENPFWRTEACFLRTPSVVWKPAVPEVLKILWSIPDICPVLLRRKPF